MKSDPLPWPDTESAQESFLRGLEETIRPEGSFSRDAGIDKAMREYFKGGGLITRCTVQIPEMRLDEKGDIRYAKESNRGVLNGWTGEELGELD